MSNQVALFNFDTFDIRIVTSDGEPWFPVVDVCKLLNLANPTAVAQNRADASEYRVFKRSEIDFGEMGVVPNRGMLCVNEGGLYKVVFKSNTHVAKRFQNWVTGTVLPAIRKDGAYVVGEEKVATGELSEDEFILLAMEKLRSKTSRLQSQVDNHLTYMAVDEFFALKHIYPGRGDSSSMGRRATRICKENKEEKRMQRRYAPQHGIYVDIGEYPVHILEEAFESMVTDGRIPANIPQMELGLSGGVQ